MGGKIYRVLIVAGEASGDLHAAKLVCAMRDAAADAEFEFFGCTGPRLREAGVEEIVAADDMSIIGLPEIGRALPMFWNAFKKLRDTAVERQANAAILVDFPDFNLKLAKSLKRRGINVFYYISPQLWAWRKYRIRTIGKYVDLLLSILPFEKQWYADRGIDHVEYVGSPLAMEVHSDLTREEFCEKHGIDASRPIISLLPGSRHKEVVKILPPMLEAARLMAVKKPDIQFLIALAAIRDRGEVESAIAAFDKPLPKILVIQGETFDALNASAAAAVASGTATLETAIIGTPMAIVYKATAFNYALLRPLIDVPHFGLINLIAEKRVAKELIQNAFTPESLSSELLRLLEPQTNREARKELAAVVDKLGHGGASRRAAEAIIRSLSGLMKRKY